MKRFDRSFYKLAVALFAMQGTLSAADAMLSPQESYFLRRIHEFWKDKDYSLVKSQIADFLDQHPHTGVKDQLYAILGDLYFQESNYADAATAYQKISSAELKEKTLYKHIVSLQAEKKNDDLLATGLPYYQGGSKAKCDFSEEVQFILGETVFEKMSVATLPENKRQMAETAKSLFAGLSSDPYKLRALMPLAKLHEELGEYPQAYSLYALMAEKFPDQKEGLLFQAASFQLHFDKAAAVNTYDQVLSLQGPLASDAAYNQLVLLFQQKAYDELISARARLEKALDKGKQPLFDFCLGRAYYELEKYTESSQMLEQFLASDEQNPSYRKAAFMTLFLCAEKKGDLSLFDRQLAPFLSAFSQEADAPKVLLSHFNLAIKQEKKEEALSDLKQLISSYPEFEGRENALYNFALLLFKSQDWTESRKAFAALQEQFPSSPLSKEVPGYLLHCSMERAKIDKSEAVKTELASDLKQTLASDFLSVEEKPVYHLILIKTEIDLKQNNEALSAAEQFLASYAYHPSAGEAHLLAAYAAEKIPGADDRFIEHAELALQMDAPMKDASDLRLRLFNTYLKREEWQQAAGQLFRVLNDNKRELQLQNLLWLANYYAAQQEKEKALTVYQKLLGIEDDQMELHVKLDKPVLEVEAMKCAALLDPNSKIKLLTSLSHLQSNHPEAGWKFQRQIQFELAAAHSSLGSTEKAIGLYDSLIAASGSAPSYFSQAAKLEKARLLFSLTEPSERSESNPKMVQVLSLLKDLQIQKKIYSEPIHLEAGLEYADIRTALAPEEKKSEVALFFLRRAREDFLDKGDLASHEYHEALKKQSDKQKLFQCYLDCLNAEIAVNELEWDNARDLLESVVQNESATAYLKLRAQEKLKSLP